MPSLICSRSGKLLSRKIAKQVKKDKKKPDKAKRILDDWFGATSLEKELAKEVLRQLEFTGDFTEANTPRFLYTYCRNEFRGDEYLNAFGLDEALQL